MRNKDIKKALDGYFAVLSSYQPVYSTFAGGVYEMELTRAAIHCFATHCSKLKPEVIGNAAPALGRVLQFKPNPLMDTKKYLYRLATAYMTDNNAVIAPIMEYDEIKGFYPMAVGKAQLIDYGGQTYVRYDMGGGEYFAAELSKCGILNQFQYTNELWGESNLCLRPTLELIDAQNQGIINGIKNSAVIRFIAKLANSLKPKDVKEEQERLKEINLGISNTAGIFVIDQKYEDVKQIDSKPYIINPSQMEYIKQNVFNYFGTNEHILQNKFTPDEWNAYYEGKIEPFALEIGLVHTNMTFTEREKSFGNQIFFSSNRLQYASIQDKINYVVQMGDRGRTSINEDREVFNLPPIPGGDRHFIRGEYRPVDSYGEPVEPAEMPEGNTQAPISGNTTVDKGVQGGIIEAREPVFGDGHKIVDNTPEGGDESGSDGEKTSDDGDKSSSDDDKKEKGGYSFSSKVKPEFKETFNTEFDAMSEKFGTISTITRVVPMTWGTDRELGEFSDNSGELAIRFAEQKGGAKKLSQAAIDNKKAGVWSSSHPNHVIRHEIGHAIQLEHKKNDPHWNDKLGKIDKLMRSAEKSSVSTYALRNRDEFISECIAESMTTKARPMSKQVANIITGDDSND